jgi:hypothetical protein
MRALAVAGVVATASIAHAGEHPTVQLDLDACVAAPDEIRRVVAVELGALLETGDAGADRRTRVAVTCDGTAVALRVDDPITNKSLARTIDLAGALPAARSRLLALAIAELVSASWTELELDPDPTAPLIGPHPTLAGRDAALTSVHARAHRAPAPPARLVLDGGGEKFFAGSPMLAGAGLRVERDSFDPIGWVVDGEVHHGDQMTAIGRVSTDVLGVGGAIVVHRGFGRWHVHLGGGARGGAVELAGVAATTAAARGERFWAPWLGVLATGSVEVVLAHRFVLGARLETGEVISPVGGTVDGRRIVAIDGAWLEASIGIGVEL